MSWICPRCFKIVICTDHVCFNARPPADPSSWALAERRIVFTEETWPMRPRTDGIEIIERMEHDA